MDAAERLLEAEADKQAEIEDLVEQNRESLYARFNDLLASEENRDFELFTSAGVDPEIILADLEAVPVLERDPVWSAIFSGMVAACWMQAWIDIYGVDYLGTSEGAGQTIEEARRLLKAEELKRVAKVGIGKDRFQCAKEKRAENKPER